MYRREFLTRVALSAPVALASRSLWAETLARTDTGRTPDSKGQYEAPLSASEKKLVAALADGIIPTTDTPGAIGAGVPEFISLLFSEWLTRAEQVDFRKGLAQIDADCHKAFGRPFTELAAKDQATQLLEWDQDAFAERPHDAPKPFFRRFKELTVIGYYTSEVGQNQELQAQFGGGQDTPGGPVSQPPPFRI